MSIVSLKRRDAAVQQCGLEVSAGALGYATMKSSTTSPTGMWRSIRCAVGAKSASTFLDSSNAYGRGGNEELEGHRHEYVIASKFGNLRASDGSSALRVLGRCIRHCDGFKL